MLDSNRLQWMFMYNERIIQINFSCKHKNTKIQIEKEFSYQESFFASPN